MTKFWKSQILVRFRSLELSVQKKNVVQIFDFLEEQVFVFLKIIMGIWNRAAPLQKGITSNDTV